MRHVTGSVSSPFNSPIKTTGCIPRLASNGHRHVSCCPGPWTKPGHQGPRLKTVAASIAARLLATDGDQVKSGCWSGSSSKSSRQRDAGNYPGSEVVVKRRPLSDRNGRNSSTARRRVSWSDQQKNKDLLDTGSDAGRKYEVLKVTSSPSTGSRVAANEPTGDDDEDEARWWWDTACFDLTSVTTELPTGYRDGWSWLTSSLADDRFETRQQTSDGHNIDGHSTTGYDRTTNLGEIRLGHRLPPAAPRTPVRRIGSRDSLARQRHPTATAATTSALGSRSPEDVLLDAAARGRADVVADILALHRVYVGVTLADNVGDLVNCRCPSSGNTPLHLAVANGYSSIAADLIDFGANVNAVNNRCRGPLHLAARYGRKHCSRLLLDAGSQPDQSDTNGESALHLAVRHDHVGVVQSLLTMGCQTNLQNKDGCTALHLAVCLNRMKSLKFLLRSSTSIRTDIVNSFGQTALDLAIERNDKMAIALITKKMTIDARIPNESAPIYTTRTGQRTGPHPLQPNGCLAASNSRRDGDRLTAMSASSCPAGRRQMTVLPGPSVRAVDVPDATLSRSPDTTSDCSCCENKRRLSAGGPPTFSPNVSFII